MSANNGNRRTYVVTAAAGRTGDHVARGLLKAGHAVRALARDAVRLKPLAELGAEVMSGDLVDEAFMTRSFEGADAAYLVVAGDHGSRDFRRSFADAGAVYARAATAARLPAAVFLSTIGAHDDLYRGFILTHGDVEHNLNQTVGIDIMHLRAPKFFENLFYFLPASQAADALATPLDPDASFDAAYSRDIGEAALQQLLALDFRGISAVELHGREILTMRLIAQRLSRLAGRNIPAQRVRREDNIEEMVAAEMHRDFSNLINDTWDTFSRHGALRDAGLANHMIATTSIDEFLSKVFLPKFDRSDKAA